MQKMSKHDIAPPTAQRWTRIEDYAVGLTRVRNARRARRERVRTEPESPALILSTLPFAALIAVFGILTIVFAIAAWPGRELPQAQPKAEQHELGTAPKGWFDEAKKEFR